MRLNPEPYNNAWASSAMASPAAFSSVYIASMYVRRSASTCVAFVCVKEISPKLDQGIPEYNLGSLLMRVRGVLARGVSPRDTPAGIPCLRPCLRARTLTPRMEVTCTRQRVSVSLSHSQAISGGFQCGAHPHDVRVLPVSLLTKILSLRL